ncbi:Isochorismatase-like protein [Dichotomopilus funicola]|uniref:Isochorismatase-like protein n=1 Tax=Dichotomopilus funicola TaxID=1934379 RepID=A0AAN6UVE5_9PEZI|nr:Isochorismatase-like protein [Dichotomopilus funicola]
MASKVSVVGNPKSRFWLFHLDHGFDLTHPSSPDQAPSGRRIKLPTTTMPVTVAPEKKALVIIDMQNIFLSPTMFGKVRGEGHEAEDTLLRTGIPAARNAGIQIVHVTWGISEKELHVLPPIIFRIFRFSETENDEPGGMKEVESDLGVGVDYGDVKLPSGSTVSAGRLLMRDQWNTALHNPLQQEFDKSQTTALPDVRFHKSRLSGFWGGTTPCIEYLKEKGITTLLFAGVNTDQCVLASLQDACNVGFDTILLRDGCGTISPEYATKMVELNCRKSWVFMSSCYGLENGVKSMETL